MKSKITKFLNNILVIAPVCALIIMMFLSMNGCTKKDASGKNDNSSGENSGTIIENDGDLDISISEDEETFGE